MKTYFRGGREKGIFGHGVDYVEIRRANGKVDPAVIEKLKRMQETVDPIDFIKGESLKILSDAEMAFDESDPQPLILKLESEKKHLSDEWCAAQMLLWIALMEKSKSTRLELEYAMELQFEYDRYQFLQWERHALKSFEQENRSRETKAERKRERQLAAIQDYEKNLRKRGSKNAAYQECQETRRYIENSYKEVKNRKPPSDYRDI